MGRYIKNVQNHCYKLMNQLIMHADALAFFFYEKKKIHIYI
jgi:hypothetical protein